MSNKTQLQSNNVIIFQNNADLQDFINIANNLPEAGSGDDGGSVETCTVEIVSSHPIVVEPVWYYINSSIVVETYTGLETTLILAKNTMLVAVELESVCMLSGSCS